MEQGSLPMALPTRPPHIKIRRWPSHCVPSKSTKYDPN